MVPDTSELAERPKACLTDSVGNSVPIDYTKLFDSKLFSISSDMGRENIGSCRGVF